MSVQQEQKYFVTGAAGFIGSHLTERLLSEGACVTGYDNLSSGRREWLKNVLQSERFSFMEADLLDLDALTEAMRGHSTVVHLGANGDIPGGNLDPAIDLQNGTLATYNVLQAMRTTGAHSILFSSSSTVYGDEPPRPTPETAGPCLPITQYGAGKLAAEGLISAFCHLYGLQSWIFRFGNVIGARMGHGVLHDFIAKLERNPRELEILGDGKQEKNYFLVEDCVDGMFYAYRYARKRSCDVFNLGCEDAIPVDAIAQIVIEEMGLLDVRLRHTGGERGWPGDVPRVIYDLSKIKQIGWQPPASSAAAIRTAVRRLLEQRRATAGAG